jgi:hypothetical protein
MCSECYTGWLTHWGEGGANTSSSAPHVDAILSPAYNGSVSLYMGHGGTVLVVAHNFARNDTARLALLAGICLLQFDSINYVSTLKAPTLDTGLVRCAFSAEIYTRGCHWIPRMFA